MEKWRDFALYTIEFVNLETFMSRYEIDIFNIIMLIYALNSPSHPNFSLISTQDSFTYTQTRRSNTHSLVMTVQSILVMTLVLDSLQHPFFRHATSHG